MELRKVEGRDRSRIVSIIDSADNLSPEEKDCAKELLDIYLGSPSQKDYHFMAAVEAGGLAGYICYGRRPLTDATYDLYWILVHQDFRRVGVATALLGRMEALLRVEGGRLVVAETSGLEGYEPARRFYARNGFGEEARIKDFYKPGDDIIVYVKRL